MALLPALCLSCSRVMLVSIADAQNGQLVCTTCGADARIVPGCSFNAAERAHFEELSEIVAQSNIKPTEAYGYAEETQRSLRSGAYAAQLERLTTRLLGLLPLSLAAGKNPDLQRRILSKLQTIFEALGTARAGSAEYGIAPIATPTRADKA